MTSFRASWHTRVFLALLFIWPAARGAAPAPNIVFHIAPTTGWYQANSSSTVFVFVHGIFSNSIECWTSKSGVYWPQLLRSDARFGSPSIYLGSYHTDYASGLYRVPDAATELLTYMRVKDPRGRMPMLDKPNIVFIAHSTGGLVVRYMLERNQELFKSKHIGLVLLASPSRGSAWADRMKLIRKAFGNRMAGQLERDNDFLADLDGRFFDLVMQKRLPGLVGIDLFENNFVVAGPLFHSAHVVSAQDSASYFGAYKIIPDSDHFTIAKPTWLGHPSHQYLLDFYETVFRPSLPADSAPLLPLFPGLGRRLPPPQ